MQSGAGCESGNLLRVNTLLAGKLANNADDDDQLCAWPFKRLLPLSLTTANDTLASDNANAPFI